MRHVLIGDAGPRRRRRWITLRSMREVTQLLVRGIINKSTYNSDEEKKKKTDQIKKNNLRGKLGGKWSS